MRRSDRRQSDRILKIDRFDPRWFVTGRIDLYNPYQDIDALYTSERYRIA